MIRTLLLVAAALLAVPIDACDARFVPRDQRCAKDGHECRLGDYCVSACMPKDDQGTCVGLQEAEMKLMMKGDRHGLLPKSTKFGWAPKQPIAYRADARTPLPVVKRDA